MDRRSSSPVDPASLWAWWEPDNPNEVYRVVQRYAIAAKRPSDSSLVRESHDPAGSAERLTIVEDWTANSTPCRSAGETVIDRPNPYGFIPYVIYPNIARPHEFWGASDLEDLIDVCRELNGG